MENTESGFRHELQKAPIRPKKKKKKRIVKERKKERLKLSMCDDSSRCTLPKSANRSVGNEGMSALVTEDIYQVSYDKMERKEDQNRVEVVRDLGRGHS